MKSYVVFFGVMLCVMLGACGAKETAPVATPEKSQYALKFQTDKETISSLISQWDGSRCQEPRAMVKELDATLKTAPDNAVALGLKGLALSQLGEREPAFESITEGIKRLPAAQLYAWRALILLRSGQLRGAAHDSRYALNKMPSEPVAQMVQGALLLDAGDTGKGCAQLSAACKAGECERWELAQQKGLCPR